MSQTILIAVSQMDDKKFSCVCISLEQKRCYNISAYLHPTKKTKTKTGRRINTIINQQIFRKRET
jgi:hypothetical protein